MNLKKLFKIHDSVSGKAEYEDARYERKFGLDNLSAFGAEQIILNHQACFKEIYRERYINNIYFDTQNLTFYYDNISGKSQRKKYRIRWYNDLLGNIENPVLEIKIKSGLLGTKKSYPLSSFCLEAGISTEDVVKRSLLNSQLPDIVKQETAVLFPVLINRYKRKYFSDFTKRFRITIDSGLEYFNISGKSLSLLHCFKDFNNTVIELKYQKDYNDFAANISEQFPFRMTKNSKYVNGIEKFFRIPV